MTRQIERYIWLCYLKCNYYLFLDFIGNAYIGFKVILLFNVLYKPSLIVMISLLSNKR